MNTSRLTRPSRFAAAVLLVAFCAARALADVDVSAVEHVNPARPVIPERVFKLTDFGAVADRKTLNTEAFKKAIAAVDQAGGGPLVVPAGVFVTQPFTLCSKLDLHLEAGAVIQAPDNFAAYGFPDPATLKSPDAVPGEAPPPFISAKRVHDLALTGPGTIDGNGALWWAWSERAARAAGAKAGRLVYKRANLVVIENCERLYVADITFRNSPKFHLVPRNIHELTIERVKVRAPFDAPNTDAIDPGPVVNGVIRDCDIDTGDDDIAVKSGAKNLLIENIAVKHGHGISIGSETIAGINGMLVRNCTFDGTDNGIRIKSMRGAGGVVENVRYTNIQMKDVDNAIVLDLNYTDNNRPNFKGKEGAIPAIRDVLIDHVTAVGSKKSGRIVGLPESPIRRLTLRAVSISAEKDFVVADAEEPVREQVTLDIRAGVAPKKQGYLE